MTYGFIADEGSDSEECTDCYASPDTECCKNSHSPDPLIEEKDTPQLSQTPKLNNRNNSTKLVIKYPEVESTDHFRVKKAQHPKTSVPQPQMTVERPMAFLAPLQSGMDNRSRHNTDQSLQPDAWSPEQTSVYAASPTSLYMQEQEKNDMQSFYTGCASQGSSGLLNEELELKPQYEVSFDIASMTAVSSKSNILGESSISMSNPFTTTPSTWCSTSQATDSTSLKIEDFLQIDENSDVLGPTLAELNDSESTLVDEFETPQSSVSTCVSTLTCTTTRPVCADILSAVVKSEPKSNNTNLCTHTVSSTDCNHHKSDLLTNMSGKSVYSSDTSNRALLSWPYNQRANVSQAETVLASSVYNSAGLQKNLSSSSHPNYSSTNSSPLNNSKLSLQQLLLSGHRHTSLSLPVSSTVSSRKRTISETTVSSQDNLEDTWKEIEEFIHEDSKEVTPASEGSKYPRIGKRTRMDSGSSTVYSYDEDYDDSDDDLDSDLDSDLDDFSDSDSIGSQGSLLTETTQTVGRNKEKQYFWQYNVQSKGPKGAKLDLHLNMDDPHILMNFEDPVFDPENSSVIGVRHRGNARKGDGNEVSPNPKKLYQIGLQLRKLTRQINGIQPSDLPSSARNKSRKEKNKLASRACRLKKKAQHEANKVKLYGLELEQKQLVTVLRKIKKATVERMKLYKEEKRSPLYDIGDKKPLSPMLEETIKEQLNVMIAGNSADYVNSVIKQVEDGDSTGGIPKHVKKKTRLNFINTG